MRHRKSGKKLGRNTSHRKAMMRNMVTSFFDTEKITTTDARAKELRKMAEKLITMARRGDLHSRRLIMQVVRDGKTVAKLFDTIAPRYADRPGGYTRIVRLSLKRLGDNGQLVLLQLVGKEENAGKKVKASSAKKRDKKQAGQSDQVEKPDKSGETSEVVVSTDNEQAVEESNTDSEGADETKNEAAGSEK